jgi:histidine ammonia-lyase
VVVYSAINLLLTKKIISCYFRGHSGVRLEVLKTLERFLELNIIPCVPLRGSISASGDLSPLSYIAGAITGHPDVMVFDTQYVIDSFVTTKYISNTVCHISGPEGVLSVLH